MSDKAADSRTGGGGGGGGGGSGGGSGDIEASSKAVEAHPTTTKTWQTVNKRLLPVKGYYFFFLAGKSVCT